MRCYYHPDYVYSLPEEHPFPMDKFWRAEALLRDAALPGVEVCAVSPVAEADLARVHTAGYLEKVRRGDFTHEENVRLGLPWRPELYDRSRLEVAGTLAAARAALHDRLACNLAGGTHHAFADRGLGYCVFNDVAVAIRALHAEEPGLRVFVLDTDAHQGNGTHSLFAGDGRVFTYSIHVGRNYPAEKTPGSLDVELPRYASGEEYLERLRATALPSIDAFRPHLVLWIAGADVHAEDRFGQLRLSDDDIAERDYHLLLGLKERRLPAAILYGGGYNRDRLHTARLHADTVKRAAAFA